MTMRAHLLCLILLLLTLTACDTDDPAVVEELPATATLLPIPSQQPRFTATPVPSRTPLPTYTFTPTETSVPPSPTLSATPTLTPTIAGIVQSLQRVNVREGPGTNYSAIDALAPGTGVQIVGRNTEGNWLNIRLEDGSEGWIAARLIFLPPTPTAFPTLTPSPDLTALFLGTPLPTAIIGGGTLTPTPPLSVVTATPVGGDTAETTAEADGTDSEAVTETPTTSFIPEVPVVNIDQINMTATALVAGAATLTPSSTPEPDTADTDTADDDDNRLITIEPLTTAEADTETVAQANTATPTDDPDASVNATLTAIASANPPATRDPEATDEPDSVVDPEQGLSPDDVASLDGLDVFAFCDNAAYGVAGPPVIAAGTDIDIFWAWFARTEQQVITHLSAAQHELRLNGEELEVSDEYRTRIFTQNGDFVTYWYIPVLDLEPGDYEITYSVTWDRAIFDGYEYFGPGTSNPFEQETCSFTVR